MFIGHCIFEFILSVTLQKDYNVPAKQIKIGQPLLCFSRHHYCLLSTLHVILKPLLNESSIRIKL